MDYSCEWSLQNKYLKKKWRIKSLTPIQFFTRNKPFSKQDKFSPQISLPHNFWLHHHILAVARGTFMPQKKFLFLTAPMPRIIRIPSPIKQIIPSCFWQKSPTADRLSSENRWDLLTPSQDPRKWEPWFEKCLYGYSDQPTNLLSPNQSAWLTAWCDFMKPFVVFHASYSTTIISTLLHNMGGKASPIGLLGVTYSTAGRHS